MVKAPRRSTTTVPGYAGLEIIMELGGFTEALVFQMRLPKKAWAPQ